jgi:hypothetical protein
MNRMSNFVSHFLGGGSTVAAVTKGFLKRNSSHFLTQEIFCGVLIEQKSKIAFSKTPCFPGVYRSGSAYI